MAKDLKKCMKLYYNFQRGGGGVLEENPFCGEVWIFLELRIGNSTNKLEFQQTGNNIHFVDFHDTFKLN